MKVLIIGINGFIGRATASAALAQGHQVTGLSRSQNPNLGGEIVYVVGERSDLARIRTAVADGKIDVVVDVIAMTCATTEPLLARLEGVVDQYILISSSDVYANYELLQKRVQGKANLAAVDEDSDLRSTRFPHREGSPRSASDPNKYLDDYDKIPIEQAVQRLSCAWTILRLPMVYGTGDLQNRFRWAISPMSRGVDTIVVPTGWSNWVSTYGYIENVGAAIALVMGDSRAKNRVFNIAETRSVSQFEWAEKFARVIDWEGRIETTADPDDAFVRRVANLDLAVPFKISGARFRDELGYTDVVDEVTALQRTVSGESLA